MVTDLMVTGVNKSGISVVAVMASPGGSKT